MAGNKSSSSNDKPLWRPLAHKLSSLIPLRRLNKAKSKPDVRSDHASPSNASDFRLDVQLNGLESLRLPSSWLLQPKDADKQSQQQSSPADASHQSAKLSHPFSRKPVNRHQGNRPLTFIDSPSDADQHQARASALEALTNPDASTTPSILDRGRPVEARHLIHQPVKNLKNHRKSLPLDLETMFQAPNEDHDSNALRTATIRLVPNESLIATPSVKESPRWTAAQEARLAMPPPPRPLSTIAIDTPSTASPSKALQIPRNPQLALKRPTSLGPPAPKAAESTSSDKTSSTDSTPITRVNSKRPGALSDRLAWMRKLEEKENTKPNNDLTVLQKRAGSVSDKLAMFEKKNLSVTSASSKRLQLPARNPSSQYSASVRESIFSADGSAYAPSPRTSMDTARTSSVMSYYDDSFREKLESIVGQEPEANKQTE
ncbi:uncharacterized protein BKA55DRAFT_578322 [Fusarium redolens]|uniref:Uncharacterized protein n=1 Tax=Fusarium redolens TaxID=48865 RepID=A0A9P9GH11_FUSRE|nr:uncharacterized protein BKA55DRAFT_578322 [Fusarium redolens]KAH7237802.1 hypothetical protein BKA55DRAFT_578322 [Fusarium redolens]